MSGNPEQHEGPLLTREEARRVLRVNETTLDSWLRKGRLESVGYEDDGHRETILVVCDEKLKERAATRLQEKPIDLTVDHLPARARHELLRMMMSRRDARSVSKQRVQHPLANSVSRPTRRRRRFEGRRKHPIVRDEQTAHPVVRTESREEARNRRSRLVTKAMQKTRSTKRKIVRRRGKVSRPMFDVSDELVEMLFPPELLKKPRRRRVKSTELAALEELVETTNQPEAVEELWGEELLSLVAGAADSLAADAVDLIASESSEETPSEEIVPEALAGALDSLESRAADQDGDQGDEDIPVDGVLVEETVESPELDQIPSAEEQALDVDSEETTAGEALDLGHEVRTEEDVETVPELALELEPEPEEASSPTDPVNLSTKLFKPCAGDILPVEACWEDDLQSVARDFDPEGPRVLNPEVGPVALADTLSERIVDAKNGAVTSRPEPTEIDDSNAEELDLDNEVDLMLEERASSDFSTIVDEAGAVPPRPRDQVHDWVDVNSSPVARGDECVAFDSLEASLAADTEELTEEIEAMNEASSVAGEEAIASEEPLEEMQAAEEVGAITEAGEENEAEQVEVEEILSDEGLTEEATVVTEEEVRVEPEEATSPIAFETEGQTESLEDDLFAETSTELSSEFGADSGEGLSAEFASSEDVEAELDFATTDELSGDDGAVEAESLEEDPGVVLESNTGDELAGAKEARGSVFGDKEDAVAAAFDFRAPVEMPEPVLEAESVLSMSLSERPASPAIPFADSDIVPTDEELADLLASPVVLSHGATNLLADAETAAVLRNIEEGVDKLTAVVENLQKSSESTSEAPDLQPVIDAIREDIAHTRESDTTMAKSLERVAEQVAEIHTGVQATNKVAISSVSAVQGIRKEVERDLLVRRVLSSAGVVQGKSEEQGSGMATMMIGMAVLLMTWAVTFYVKTGDLRLTIGALVMANLVGCATIIYTKSGKVL